MNSRAEKLEKLEKKPKSSAVMTLDASGLLTGLQNKINELKAVMGAGVGVDIDALTEELNRIDQFMPAIKELVDAIDSIDIPKVPDFPENIDINGLKELSEHIQKHNEALSSLKVPESIKVIGLAELTKNIKNYERYTKKLSEFKIPDASIRVDLADKKAVQNLVQKLEELTKAVGDSNIKFSQAMGDYVPFRRVRYNGNQLQFDDDSWSGHGGGGGGGSNMGIDESNSIFVNGVLVEVKFTIIQNASSGAIVSGVANKKIRVLSYVLVASDTTNLKWQSNATDLSGLFYLIGSTGVSSGYSPKGHFQTAAGETLNLSNSGSKAVGGHLSYIEV